MAYLKKFSIVDLNNQRYIDFFNKLKRILCYPLALAYPKFDKTYVLTSDASIDALGTVLSQNGHPIAFSSRTLDRHERNYRAIEKVVLAIIWSVNYFRPYLFCRKYRIQTNHRTLMWLHSLKEPNMKLQRWKIQINEYNFDIEYIVTFLPFKNVYYKSSIIAN